MTLSCLSAPFRLLGLAMVAAVLYVGWINRDEVRRVVHRLTADSPPPPDVTDSPQKLKQRAVARLDSLAKRLADSVVLTAAEVSALVAAEIERRAAGVADSIGVELLDGAVAVRGAVDAGRLPKSSLGPLAEWISGRQRVEVRGPLSLLRLGIGEWRIDQVTIRGIPLPRGLWERLLTLVVPGTAGSITFPVDEWVTGIRVKPGGATLYGRAER